jgi:MoxR-like ATPase
MSLANAPVDSPHQAMAAVNSVLLGKSHVVRLAMACLIAGGHLLIEDLPGMGKTILAQALARTLGLSFRRVQFTNDMLPGDLTGAAVFVREKGEFVFHPGPLFTQLLLADEINRASPKTQSALLEAMEERQVSSDGITRPLPAAVLRHRDAESRGPAVDQPPAGSATGSLLDAALTRLSGRRRRDGDAARRRPTPLLERQAPTLASQQLLGLQKAARAVHASDALLAYVRQLAEHTRHSAGLAYGLSPRAALALLAAGRAWALLEGRGHVLPADIQRVFPAVAMHRLDRGDARAADTAAAAILDAVALP